MSKTAKVLLGISALLVLLILSAYLLPRMVRVERSRTINQPVGILFESVNNLKNWEGWSPWHQIDTAMEITYHGMEGQGASYTWKSENKKAGSGTLTITESRANEYIATSMDFGKQGAASAWYRFVPSDSGTVVTWGFESDMGNSPIGRYVGLMMDKWIGADYEKGLDNLEKFAPILDALKRQSVVVKADSIVAQTYLYIRTTCLNTEIGQKMGADYGTLMAYMQQQGAPMKGYPFAIYEAFDSVKTTFCSAIPCDAGIKGDGAIKIGQLMASQAVVGYYYGSYQMLEKGHTAVQQYIAEQNKQIAGMPMEFYITDPTSEKDTSRWLTQIWYPVN